MDVAAQQATVLLNRLVKGDRASESQLMPLIYQNSSGWLEAICAMSVLTTPWKRRHWCMKRISASSNSEKLSQHVRTFFLSPRGSCVGSFWITRASNRLKRGGYEARGIHRSSRALRLETCGTEPSGDSEERQARVESSHSPVPSLDWNVLSEIVGEAVDRPIVRLSTGPVVLYAN